MSRGFVGIGLNNVKCNANIGSVLRLAGNYNVSFVALSGNRYSRQCTDTMKYYRHNPVFQVEDILSVIPYDCVPVAVDLLEDAIPLHKYQHPERAYYIFGAEDQTLGKNITDKCRDKIYIPTNRCLNLAMAVATVLYDKQHPATIKGLGNKGAGCFKEVV